MDWTTIITSALAVLFGGGWFATWRAQRREDKKASNEEWQTRSVENRAEFPELRECDCSRIRANLYSAATCGVFLGGARGKRINKGGCCR